MAQEDGNIATLAVDIGGSGVKVIVLNKDGTAQNRSRLSTHTATPKTGTYNGSYSNTRGGTR